MSLKKQYTEIFINYIENKIIELQNYAVSKNHAECQQNDI